MKKFILPILLLFAFFQQLFTQVTSVNYWINYNENTSSFDCYAIINDGSAIDANDRELLNAHYTVVVPTGSTVSISDRFNPLVENSDYSGTLPTNWTITSFVQNPYSSPGNDFFGITSGPTSDHFNDLSPLDTIKLFSLTVTPEICANTMRLFNNNTDPLATEPGMENKDLTQKMSIGSLDQDYVFNSEQGNTDFPIGQLNQNTAKVGESFYLSFNSGEWTSNNTSVATTTLSGHVSIVDTGYCTFKYINENGCKNTTSDLFVATSNPPIITIMGPNVNCGDDTISLLANVIFGFGPYSYEWSNGSTSAQIDVSPDIPSMYSVTITDKYGESTTAYHQIFVHPKPMIAFTGPQSICEGDNTMLTPSSGGIWISSNPILSTISNIGVASGLHAGFVTFKYTSIVTGCTSEPSDTLIIKPKPSVLIAGQNVVFIGDSTTLYPSQGGVWESNNPDVASVNNQGIVIGAQNGLASFTYISNTTLCTSTTTQISFIHQLPPSVCVTGVLILDTQDEVNAFQQNYPGCTIIDGNLGITGSVHNLNELIQVTSITGGLQIINCPLLSDIQGLTNVRHIGTNVLIQNNSNITMNNGLNSLNFVGGDFWFINNKPFQAPAFHELDTILGTIKFDSPQVNLSGLNSLDFIGGNIDLKGLSNLGSIASIDSVRGNLIINYCDISNINFSPIKIHSKFFGNH